VHLATNDTRATLGLLLYSKESINMKTLACLAVLALVLAGCSYHTDTVVQKPVPMTTTVLVPAA